jgi:hypothetical protein
MKVHDIKRLVSSGAFIEGIYNYCDRWCERCGFTSRCLNFAMGEEMDRGKKPGPHDAKNREYWDSLNEVFELTMEMLHDCAKEAGVDLDAMADDPAIAGEVRATDRKAKNNAAAKAANAYAKIVNAWFKEHMPRLERKRSNVALLEELEIDSAQQQRELSKVIDAVEVIRWYQYQIYVKIVRACTSLSPMSEEPDEYPKDSDGSAKVALIGIDRSIGAWGIIRKEAPEQADEVLDILLHLDRLRRRIEKKFPDARGFIRPGFDA